MKQMHAQTILQQVTQGYDTIASHFSQTRTRSWPVIEHVLTRYMKSGQMLLDVGCGNGRVANVALKIKLGYTGLDNSAGLLAHARATYPQLNFVQGSMTGLPFADQQFDVCLAVASFHHLPGRTLRQAALLEMRRVLKPGGKIILINWNLHSRRHHWQRRWKNLQHFLHMRLQHWNDLWIPWKDQTGRVMANRYYHGFTEWELSRLARRCGLTVLVQWYEVGGEVSRKRHGHNLVTVLEKNT